jgi:outer membrane protein TolC
MAVRQSRDAYLPRVRVGASWAWHDPDIPFGTEADSWAVRAGLTWDIFDGGSRSQKKGRTLAQMRALEYRQTEAGHRAAFQGQEAHLRAQEARLTMDIARQSVGEAEESHRLMLQRFAEELATLSELLTAQSALDRVRLEALLAETRYLLALGSERFHSGSLIKELLPEKENDQ